MTHKVIVAIAIFALIVGGRFFYGKLQFAVFGQQVDLSQYNLIDEEQRLISGINSGGIVSGSYLCEVDVCTLTRGDVWYLDRGESLTFCTKNRFDCGWSATQLPVDNLGETVTIRRYSSMFNPQLPIPPPDQPIPVYPPIPPPDQQSTLDYGIIFLLVLIVGGGIGAYIYLRKR